MSRNDKDTIARGIGGVLSGGTGSAPAPVRRVLDDKKEPAPARNYIGRGRPAAGEKTGWEGVDVQKTSFIISRAKYDKLKEISIKRGITIKTLIDEFITDGLLKYSKR